MSIDDEPLEVTRGSGNVFRDLGVPNPDVEHAKAILAAKIIGILDDREISFAKAAELTGFDAGDFSRIRHTRLNRFTVDKLIKIVTALDDSLEVTLRVDRRAPVTASINAPQPG